MAKNRDKKINPESEQTKHRKGFLFVVLLLTVLAVEGVGRIVYSVAYDKKQKIYLKAYFGLDSTYDPNMVSNYLPHHYLIYVLNPNVQYHYESFYGEGQVQMINSQGYRGKKFSKEKRDGVYRIICIGGSTTFGLTEKDETKTYPQMLEEELNKRFKKPTFEVINAGTPGWSSAESLINFHFRLLDLNPDMVIIYHAINDTFAMRRDEEGKSDNGNFRQSIDYKPPSKFSKKLLRISHLYRYIYARSHRVTFDINNLAVKPSPPGEDQLKNLQQATGKYFKRNMEAMVTMAHANGIVPVLVTVGHGPWSPSLPMLNEITRQIAQKKGALLVDFELYSKPGMFAGDNVHLIRAGNVVRVKVIAQALQPFLSKLN